ncbi:MAG: endolytic transglycosylase MltG [Candidatus Gracilibacteria bacterium]|jgi:UPF0755 protein|nr:endolytic transglycosylase MltG [Candidatus Gracilibacteria bacterium]
MNFQTRNLRIKRKKSGTFKIFLLLGVIFILGAFFYIPTLAHPIDENDSSVVNFDVKLGQGLKKVSENLKDEGLIKSSYFFIYLANKEGLEEDLKAGRFELSKSYDAKKMIQTLKSTPKLSVVTIQEGLRIKDIDKRLKDLGLSNEGDFIKATQNFNGYSYYTYLNEGQNLEGFLFPDTYYFDPVTFKPEKFIYDSMDNFEKKLNLKTKESGEKTLFEAIKSSGRSLNEIIIMASIIEKEVFGEKDRKMVSGILWKRLDSGWFIGADATLLYEKDDNKITKQDLEKDSPYNTRNKKGLPPTAISNPSLESIIAAIFPIESEYWYYLNALDTGETIYAKTNEEHNLNRAKHL